MIPYGRQFIDEEDIAAVADVLRSDFLTTGPKIQEFEAALCKITGTKYALACSSGTTALHLSYLALGIAPGDAVIVPSATFLATANAVRYCGGDVIFADVNSDTGLMGPHHLEEALDRSYGLNVKAVAPVHLTGECVDLSAIKKIADQHNLKIVADACHALGGAVNDLPVGACQYEDMSVFSFHPVKTIAAGEGGAITTNDEGFYKFMLSMRSHGMKPKPETGPWAYEMSELGYNYRITDIQCALALSQLNKLGKFKERRAELSTIYDEQLAALSPHIKTPEIIEHCDAVKHLYAARIDFSKLEITRAKLMERLREKGVGTQVHYIPVHTQPYYQRLYGDLKLPGAEAYYESTLSLPLYPAMTSKDVQHVIDSLKNIIGLS